MESHLLGDGLRLRLTGDREQQEKIRELEQVTGIE
jgi:hypothetical protein